MNDKYKQLSSCIQKQFKELDQLDPLIQNYEYTQSKNFVTEKLNSLQELLKDVQVSHKNFLSDIFSISSLRYNNNRSFLAGLLSFDTKCNNLCKESDLCKLLTKCNLYLSAILNTFNYLNSNYYDVKYFDKIKEYISAVQDLLTL